MFHSSPAPVRPVSSRAAAPSLFALVALLLATALPLAAQETREEAFDALSSHAGQLESWAVDYVMLMKAQGMTIPTEGRMEVLGNRMRNEMSVDAMGQSMKMKTVTDEAGVTWTETDVFGQKMVMKADAGATGALAGAGLGPASNEALIDPRRILSQLRDEEDVVFLGREQLEGTEVFSFELPLDAGLRKEIDATGQLAQLGIRPEKLQAMIGVDDGFPRLWQLVDAAGTAVVSVIYRDVQLNPELSPERFDYAPPQGANVMDFSALAEGLLSNMDESGDLASSPEVQELLGQLDIELEGAGEGAGAVEAQPPKESKYNKKFQAGDPAPDFTGEALRGGEVDLTDYQGKVVLLDFWSAGSEPYRKGVGRLIDVYAQHGGEDFEVIGVNLDTDREAVLAFLEQHPGMTWPQVFDGKGWSSEVGTLYGIEAIPHRILIGRDGVIAKTGLRGKALSTAVDEILAR